MSLPAYPAYRDSGVEWLGVLPQHWRIGCLKHALVELISGGTPESNNSAYWADANGVPWVAISDMTKSQFINHTAKSITEEGLRSKGLRVIPAGGLLYSIYASIGKVAVLGLNAATNQAILGLVINEAVANQQFSRWWLVSLEGWVKTVSSSNTQDNLNAEKVRNLPLAFPSLTEQTQIARFLDHETARIDALIGEQQRLIELLKEKRQAVISHVVTKGLDPTVPMENSGVEWLGEVPAHWAVVPFGLAFEYQEGPGIMAVDFRDEGVPLVRISGVQGRWVTLQGCNYLDPEKSNGRWGHFRLEHGDLIISGSASMGLVSEVADEAVGAIAYTGLIRLKPKAGVSDRNFIRSVVGSYQFFVQIDLLKAGSTIQHFGPTHLSQMKVALPPIDEQIKVAAYVDNVSLQFDQLLSEAEKTNDLLQERRSALISAAVTGKIDVRSWEPPASDRKHELAQEAM